MRGGVQCCVYECECDLVCVYVMVSMHCCRSVHAACFSLCLPGME